MDANEIRKWHSTFKRDDELFEIRIVSDRATLSGYFYDVEEAIKALQPYDNCHIYYSVNEVKPACASRMQFNNFRQVKGTATSKNDILHRWWMPVDVDCIRPTDVSSSDEEKAFAHEKAQEVYRFLRDNGFSDPIVCDSSSGYHLFYPIDMESTQENEDCVKAFLVTLTNRFNDDRIKIDTVLSDANRVIRLPGSFGRKGRSTAERPHRMAKILTVPKEIRRMGVGQVRAFNEKYEVKVEQPRRHYNGGQDDFNLRDFIAKNGIEVAREIPISGGGTKFVLRECPFNSDHKAPDSAIFELPSGAIAFKCFHDSCSRHDWRSLRLHFDPQAYDRERDWQQRQYEPYKPYRPERDEQPREQVEDEKLGGIWQEFSEIEDEDRSNVVSIKSGITQYDKECCGFDKPSFNIWSGNNGSAKSTLLNQIALNAVDAGYKVAIYSGELRGRRLKRWIVLQAAGKRHNIKSNYNDYDYFTPTMVKDKIVKWLNGKLFNYNTKYSHEIAQVCMEIEKIVTEKQIDMVIADNLSSLDIDDLNGQINEQQKMAIKMMQRLSEKLGIVLHLVVHPKKSEGFLRKNDVSGAKTITDLADNVFFCHRWDDDTKKAALEFFDSSKYGMIDNSKATNIVEVVKHREFGEAIGHIYKLYYESESKRLKNSPDEDIAYGWEERSEQSEITLPPMPYEPLPYNKWDEPLEPLYTPTDQETPF